MSNVLAACDIFAQLRLLNQEGVRHKRSGLRNGIDPAAPQRLGLSGNLRPDGGRKLLAAPHFLDKAPMRIPIRHPKPPSNTSSKSILTGGKLRSYSVIHSALNLTSPTLRDAGDSGDDPNVHFLQGLFPLD